MAETDRLGEQSAWQHPVVSVSGDKGGNYCWLKSAHLLYHEQHFLPDAIISVRIKAPNLHEWLISLTQWPVTKKKNILLHTLLGFFFRLYIFVYTNVFAECNTESPPVPSIFSDDQDLFWTALPSISEQSVLTTTLFSYVL